MVARQMNYYNSQFWLCELRDLDRFKISYYVERGRMHKNDFSCVWFLPERAERGSKKAVHFVLTVSYKKYLPGKNGHCWAWNTSLNRRNLSNKQNLPWLLLTLGDKDTFRYFRQPGSTSLLSRGCRYCLDTYFKIIPYASNSEPLLSLWSLRWSRLFGFEDYLGTESQLYT